MRAIPVLALAAATACSRSAPPSVQAHEPDPVRITQFYASPPNPHQGEKALVCYGVQNASEVWIDPPVERLWPAVARCFDLVPTKPEKLTLKAVGGGKQVSQTIEIVPGPPAVKLLEVSINKQTAAPGDEIMVCYKARNVVDATVAWGKSTVRNPAYGCVTDRPRHTTTYTVTVQGAGGDSDVERVTATIP